MAGERTGAGRLYLFTPIPAANRPGDRLTCPYLLVAGDMDELCPPDDVMDWMDRLTCPKELWLYEDVFHPMGEVAADVYPAIADWILEVLDNGLPDGHDVRRDLQP